MTAPKVAIRESRYRGKVGYLVTLYGSSRRVWVETREAAERCKARFKSGADPAMEDMS